MADERSLVTDEAACRAARNSLTNLRSRIAVELAWLPGVAPTRATQIVNELTGLHSFPATELPSLARANVLASVIQTMSESSDTRTVVSMILQLAASVDDVDMDEVVRDINEDRSIAGFPEIKDSGTCRSDFEILKRLHRDAVRDLLDQFSTEVLVQVMTKLVDEATEGGTRHPPGLVNDLVDTYETAAQGFIEREFEVLAALLKRAIESVDQGEEYVTKVFADVERSALNFINVAKPIQTARHASGMTHQPSRDVATSIRGLSIATHNDHHWLALPTRATDFLATHFPSVDDITESVEADRAYLSQRMEQDRQTAEQVAEFDRAITYTVDIGIIGKHRFDISPAGVRWKGQHFPLEDITRLRWGATRHSVNFIPTGTTFYISIGTDRSSISLQPRDKDVYTNIIDRLWRAVGFKVLVGYVNTLKSNGHLIVRDITLRDDCIFLTRHRLMSNDESVAVKWPNVRISTGQGKFMIFDKNNKNTFSSFSFQGDDNVFALERLIRMYFEGKKPRLSEVLD